LIVLKGEHLMDYGIHPAHLDLSLDLGLKGYLVCLIPWLFGFGLLTMIGSGYNQPAGAFVLSLCYAAAGWLLFRWARLIDRETRYPAEFHKRQLITYAFLIAFPIILALIMHRFNTIVVSTLVWQIVFSGFGEEIYWRGYFQSRLTQAFGRPWQWQGIRFGAGLLVTSLLFGISHGLNATNLLTGETGFYLWWAIWTCFSGVFFGLLREKSGGVLAPALVHGVIDGVGETLAVIFGWF
jgi:membrane protease YdiL (CAAX protease family)